MSYEFSQKRRDEIKEYFLKYYNVILSNETADDFLNSLVDLYQAFSSRKESNQ